MGAARARDARNAIAVVENDRWLVMSSVKLRTRADRWEAIAGGTA